MRSIRYTDKAARFNSQTKIKILKTENNSGIINPLFDGLTYKRAETLLIAQGSVTNPVL